MSDSVVDVGDFVVSGPEKDLKEMKEAICNKRKAKIRGDATMQRSRQGDRENGGRIESAWNLTFYIFY